MPTTCAGYSRSRIAAVQRGGGAPARRWRFCSKRKRRNARRLRRHGLAIFDALELDQIGSIRFNQELKRLDASDARWARYRGPSGTEYAHPIAMNEQARLLEKVGIRSVKIRPPGAKQGRGYKLAQFQDAWRKHGTPAPGEAEAARGRLRLIASEPD